MHCGCSPLPSQRHSFLSTPAPLGVYSCAPCGSATTTSRLLSTSPVSSRNVVASGMKRFEAFGGVLPFQPAVERLSSRVVCVLAQNPSPYTLNGTCCYLVGTGPTRVLIDAGGWPGGKDAEAQFIANLRSTLASEGVTALAMVIVTHLHTDHFGGCRALQHILGAPVPVAMLPPPRTQLSLYTVRELRTRGLVAAVASGPAPLFTSASTFGFDRPLPTWPNEDLSWDRARRTKRQLQADYHYAIQHAEFVDAWNDPLDETLPQIVLRDGETIAVADGATLRVMATPGHAQNHVALWLEEESSLFSGDHVLGYGTTALHDLHDYMASLDKMLDARPLRLYPGHGPLIADACDLLARYRAHRNAREAQVATLLSEGSGAAAYGGSSDNGGVTALAIARTLYAATPASRLPMACGNVEKILIKLWCDGAVACSDGSAGALPVHLESQRYMRALDEDYRWRWQGRRGGESRL